MDKRAHALARLVAEWVGPYWLERQRDSGSLSNESARNWTRLGNLASTVNGIVDERGLVNPSTAGWSLDWWIGADDRWHFPSRDAGVRQRLVGQAPVVETALRVPGGDAVHRVYAVRGTEDLLVVEIENQSPVPFAVALAIRPYNPAAMAAIERITLEDQTVMVDGRPALLLPSPPRRSAGATSETGDVADVVTSGRAAEQLPDNLDDKLGLSQAAFLYPLVHTATMRVAIPLSTAPPAPPTPARGRGRDRHRQRPDHPPVVTDRLPAAVDTARAWEAQTRRGMRLELPSGRLADAAQANRRFLLLYDEGLPAQRSYADAASLIAALDRYGFHDHAADVLGNLFSGLAGSPPSSHANGAALWALGEHYRLTGDQEAVRSRVRAVADAARWIEQSRHTKKRPPEPALRGLVPPGPAGDFVYQDTFWSLRGLLDTVELLDGVGEDKAAVTAVGWASGLRADLEASLALAGERLGTPAIPFGPDYELDQHSMASLVACSPLNLYLATHPAMVATTQFLSQRFCVADAFYPACEHLGLSPLETLQLAAVDLLAGDRRALRRLAWLLEASSSTFTWPEAVDPQQGGGCFGDGDDPRMAASFSSFVRNLLVRETPAGLAMCSLLPDAWLGQGLEVYHAPTHAGLLSYVVRWHGDRPALLWELQPRGHRPVRLTAPGLDAAWRSDELTGEALLNPVSQPGVEDAYGEEQQVDDRGLRRRRRRTNGGNGDRKEAQATIARRLRTQGRACGSLGSPLYAGLLELAASDVEAAGPVWRALASHAGDAGMSALALRFLGGVHRLALAGQAPALATHYPSCGGDGDVKAAWDAMRQLVGERPDEVAAALGRPLQTNEVGRSAALLGGFLSVSNRTRLPLRLLEVGASAGLNLRWDQYRYEQGDLTWGPPESPLVLADHFIGEKMPPLETARFSGVAERRGCDVAPVDPATEEGRLTLLSFVWPDQADRFSRLRAAIEVAKTVPATVDRADANDWLAAQLAPGVERPGTATVVFHSVVTQYLTDEGRARHQAIFDTAGARATPAQPLAWLRLEPSTKGFEVRLTTWPGREERLLATASGHGTDICWLA